MNFKIPFTNKSFGAKNSKSNSSQCRDTSGYKLLNYSYGVNSNWSWLTNTMAWRYYMSIAPMQDCVDRKCEAFAQNIKPVLKDLNTGDYIKEYDSKIPESHILLKYQNPNLDQTTSELLEAQSKSFEVTGHMYTIVTAINEDREPIDIEFVDPIYVQPVYSTGNEIIRYTVTAKATSETFERKLINDKYSYFNKDMSRELNDMSTFAPASKSYSNKGMSPYAGLFYELEQLQNAYVHNSSMLKNGANPSLVVATDSDSDVATLNPDQREFMRRQIEQKYQGPENAGNVMIMDGTKSVTALNISNKDMNFIEMVTENKNQIYTNRRIPLSLIDKSPKYDNMYIGEIQLFRNCVFPFAKKYFEEMDLFLMRRYRNGKDRRYILTFDPNDVDVMQYVKINEAKVISETGVVTINETREIMSYEEIPEGNVLINNSHSTNSNTESEKTEDVTKEMFIATLEQKSDLTKREIMSKVNELYGSD